MSIHPRHVVSIDKLVQQYQQTDHKTFLQGATIEKNIRSNHVFIFSSFSVWSSGKRCNDPDVRFFTRTNYWSWCSFFHPCELQQWSWCSFFHPDEWQLILPWSFSSCSAWPLAYERKGKGEHCERKVFWEDFDRKKKENSDLFQRNRWGIQGYPSVPGWVFLWYLSVCARLSFRATQVVWYAREIFF